METVTLTEAGERMLAQFNRQQEIKALAHQVRQCQGGAEYGRGFNRAVVHGPSCCGEARARLSALGAGE